MRDVYVAGVGMTLFAKQPERTLKGLAAEAVTGALQDAGVEVGEVQAAYFANAVGGSITGQEMVAGQVALRPLELHGIPVFNVENACASAASAFHLAWQAVGAGLCDVALAVGAEKMTHPDRARSFAAIGGSVDVETVPKDLPSDRSFLMDLYAQAARDYMKESGATVEDFAAVVVKNQLHGMRNPLAQYGSALSIEEVLSSRLIVSPFTLLMCSPISDGAAAAVLVSRDVALRVGRTIRVAASTVRSAGPLAADGAAPQGRGPRVSELAAQAAYAMAGLGPKDLHSAEVHEAAASAELVLYEQLGFAPVREGPALIRSGATGLGGPLPVNTSGGLLARGHPIGATGLAQIYEAVRQAGGRAGERQVEGARVTLAQNAGGWGDGDNLVSAVHIFVR
jgi:acetyl-CoA acetyltransferase